jgi:hypothetical protein
MRKLIAISTAIAVLSGCASSGPPLPPEVQGLEHQFMSGNDDTKTRLGANPTYALLERAPGGTWSILAMSKYGIARTRSNQDLLLISRNYTNVVPAWSRCQLMFKEDPKTGERRLFTFYGCPTDWSKDYAPPTSRFAYEVSRASIPTLSGYGAETYYGLATDELRRAVAQTHLIEEARAFNEGRKSFPTTPSESAPLALPAQVWMLMPNGRGEVGRYYFVPSKLKTQSNEYVDAGSTLNVQWVEGLLTSRTTPFEDMKRFKVYRRVGPTTPTDLGCVAAIIDFAERRNLDERFCGHNPAWGSPLWAVSPKLGEVKVVTVEGDAYGLRGDKLPNRAISFDVLQFDEYRVLDVEEASRIKATFH